MSESISLGSHERRTFTNSMSNGGEQRTNRKTRTLLFDYSVVPVEKLSDENPLSRSLHAVELSSEYVDYLRTFDASFHRGFQSFIADSLQYQIVEFVSQFASHVEQKFLVLLSVAGKTRFEFQRIDSSASTHADQPDSFERTLSEQQPIETSSSAFYSSPSVTNVESE